MTSEVQAVSAAETGTRERILDVALERFARQGYAATSLREIAAELGISKAALYYHFQSKQDILLGLHLRVHRLILPDWLPTADHMDNRAWAELLSVLLTTAVGNRQLLALHFREQDAMAELHRSPALERHGQTGAGMDETLVAMLSAPDADSETRIRRIAAIGVVLAGIFGSVALTGISDDDLKRILSQIAAEILRVGG